MPLLLCGVGAANADTKPALAQLSKTLERFNERCLSYLQSSDDDDDLLTFGSFCARVMLENGCAAVAGRLDPFRLSYLYKFQSRQEYDRSKRAKSAFSWTGDVFDVDKPSALWNLDHDTSKISRALLSGYSENIFWRDAYNRAVDRFSLEADYSEYELVPLEAQGDERFIGYIKGQSSRLYSELSKGVHWEFFNQATLIDGTTAKTNIADTLHILATLGYVSHFVEGSYSCLSADEAVESYVEFRKNIE